MSDGVLAPLQNKPGAAGHERDVDVALQEALANAIQHGCKSDATKSVQCCVTYDERGDVLIVVRDPGPGFDITACRARSRATGSRHTDAGSSSSTS